MKKKNSCKATDEDFFYCGGCGKCCGLIVLFLSRSISVLRIINNILLTFVTILKHNTLHFKYRTKHPSSLSCTVMLNATLFSFIRGPRVLVVSGDCCDCVDVCRHPDLHWVRHYSARRGFDSHRTTVTFKHN